MTEGTILKQIGMKRCRGKGSRRTDEVYFNFRASADGPDKTPRPLSAQATMSMNKILNFVYK